MDTTTSEYAAFRACLPEIMFVPDLALAVQVSEPEAERALLRGDYGGFFRLADRPAVLRESFLATLLSREEDPSSKGEIARLLPNIIVKS